jgi:ssDNA-binding Zn-finger/Zn-ribbon topoisomerase 1
MPEIDLTDEELDQLVSSQDEVLGLESTRLRTRAELTAQFPLQSLSAQCPHCRRQSLTLRDGKYGIFYGCSEYPRCRGTLDANQTTGAPLTPSPPLPPAPMVIQAPPPRRVRFAEEVAQEILLHRKKPKNVEPRVKTRFEIIDED